MEIDAKDNKINIPAENTEDTKETSTSVPAGAMPEATQVKQEPMENIIDEEPKTMTEGLATQYNANPVPAQMQLPADSYLYANTSSLGGVIQNVAEDYSLDPHKLEALTSVVQQKKANLSGFYDMQIGYYPGMSAESFVAALGRAADLANTVSEKKRIEAEQRGEKYTSNGLDEIIDSLQSTDGKVSGKVRFQEALSAIQEADHAQFDTQLLAEYYETLISSGVSKADAWTRTMAEQDKYRIAQDKRSVMQDFNNMSTLQEMASYTNDLYTQFENEKDPEKALRKYAQYEAALKLTQQYAKSFENDPAGFLINKDKIVQNAIKMVMQQQRLSLWTQDMMN